MKYLWIFPYYLSWHYGRGILEMYTHFKNFLLFIPRFFSIAILFKTLFSPFQRLKEHYSGGLDISNFMETLVVNVIMRVVGFFIRSFLIVIGIISFVVVFILEILAFIFWLTIPFILIFILTTSIYALFKV